MTGSSYEPTLSADGRYVAFQFNLYNTRRLIFVYDHDTDTYRRRSAGTLDDRRTEAGNRSTDRYRGTRTDTAAALVQLYTVMFARPGS